MPFHTFTYRYRFHCWANGDNAMPYDSWCKLIIDCNYTLLRVLVNYNPWKPWKWAICNPRSIAQFLHFVRETGRNYWDGYRSREI